MAGTIVSGPRSPELPRDVDAACVALASLIGAVTLARAVASPDFADQIARSIGQTLLGTHWATVP